MELKCTSKTSLLVEALQTSNSEKTLCNLKWKHKIARTKFNKKFIKKL